MSSQELKLYRGFLKENAWCSESHNTKQNEPSARASMFTLLILPYTASASTETPLKLSKDEVCKVHRITMKCTTRRWVEQVHYSRHRDCDNIGGFSMTSSPMFPRQHRHPQSMTRNLKGTEIHKSWGVSDSIISWSNTVASTICVTGLAILSDGLSLAG